MAPRSRSPRAVTEAEPETKSEVAPEPTADTGRKKAKREKQLSKRLTLALSHELNFRLENLAMINKSHKAAFALRLIDQGLRGYKADTNLKTVFAEICGQAGEAA